MKNLEDKTFKNNNKLPSGDTLRFFCVENANSVVGCDWYNSKYCLETCVFYKQQKQKEIDRAKYWTR